MNFGFLPFSSDPDYFSPLEVTYPYHRTFDKKFNDQIDRYFLNHAMGLFLAPGSSRSGFVFTDLDLGTKTFNVDISGEDKILRTFTFFIPVPGIRVDHQEVDWDNLYSEDEIVEYEEIGLKKALEKRPCCTTNKKRTEQGDPLNLVAIGALDDVYYSFIRAGWDETETIYRASVLKTIRSFLFGGRYRYSPVSTLYVFGRPQDVALQRARSSIHERNHLRLNYLSLNVLPGRSIFSSSTRRIISAISFIARGFIASSLMPIFLMMSLSILSL